VLGKSFARLANASALAAFLSAAPPALLAAQGSAQFQLSVQLQPTGSKGNTDPPSAFCRTDSLPGTFGATVTIVCSTGVVVDIEAPRFQERLSPVHGGAYRYLTQVSAGGQILGTVDFYSGLGTITSWRVVNLVDRQYVEMTLNW
jgi:hypothetical protein